MIINIEHIIIFNFIFLGVVVLVSLILIIKYAKMCIKYNKLHKYLCNHLNLITSARYGNFNSKTPKGEDDLTSKLSKNTNALLGSIIDRDKMIQEYILKEKESQNIKQDFISCLTHDLKVPIIAQDNTYDLLLNGNFGTLSDLQKNVIQNLKISNLDLKNLVVNILDAQKLDSENMKLNLENINLVNFIKSIIAQNQSIIVSKNKNVHFDYNFNEIFYDIDTLSFKRVINNLLSNALYYSKNSKNIYINLSKEEKEIKITIKDEGKGINEEDINNIFKKYYTVSKKYSNIAFGLGLYIVNKIVTAHKGKIIAKNNPDIGASFIINLPLQ